jgi:allantoin racemase
MGARIGLVVLASRAKPLYQELVEAYGMSRSLSGIRAIDNEAFYQGSDREQGDAELTAAALDLVESDGAEVVILAGSVLGARSLDIEKRVPVPTIDGVRCAIPMIEGLVRIGARTSSRGSFAAPRGRASRSLAPELQNKLLGIDGVGALETLSVLSARD